MSLFCSAGGKLCLSFLSFLPPFHIHTLFDFLLCAFVFCYLASIFTLSLAPSAPSLTIFLLSISLQPAWWKRAFYQLQWSHEKASLTGLGLSPKWSHLSGTLSNVIGIVLVVWEQDAALKKISMNRVLSPWSQEIIDCLSLSVYISTTKTLTIQPSIYRKNYIFWLCLFSLRLSCTCRRNFALV